MIRLLYVVSLLILLSLACSEKDAVSPVEETDPVRESLLGNWTGQLAELSFRPDTTNPFWHNLRNNEAYNHSYELTNLLVEVTFGDSIFSISYRYESDTLSYFYEERGPWIVVGENYPLMMATPIRIGGEINLLSTSADLNRSFCCWQANLRLEGGDPSGSGFQCAVLKMYDIQCSLDIDSLRLEKTPAF